MKLVFSQDDGAASAKFQILEGVKNKDRYSRTMSPGVENEKIVKGEEKGRAFFA